MTAGRLWGLTGRGDGDDHRGVMLSEWERKGWTYHAKGIWVRPTSNEPPVMTLFGSTNLNARSARIDTELGFVMVIPSSSSSTTTMSLSQWPSGSTPASATIEGGNEAPTAAAGLDDGKDALINSPNMTLRLQLADEVDRICLYAKPWRGGERKVRFWTKVIVGIVKDML